MLLEMFVNELSLASVARDTDRGQELAAGFVKTIAAAAQRGVMRRLRIPEDFFGRLIAPGYDWNAWLSDSRVEREVRQYLRSLGTQAPFLRDLPEMESEWANIDCLWNGERALGLKAAYVADGLAISVGCRPEWDSSSITCEIQEIVDDDISVRDEAVHHASNAANLDLHGDWIRHRIQSNVSDGGDLWQRASVFFPLLSYCAEVEEQMRELPSNSLSSIVRGLFCLNAFCLEWRDGGFNPQNIPCAVSPESEPTLNLYAADRTFSCPSGDKRVFSWHAKVGTWRIYFDPAEGPGRLLVGYVGRHLRTVRFH
ncbi:MAG TPA: hypothetical protein VJX67_25635 [Blastocatellia bacterium]|nr:hypothetical protein [Blastocatellia bacterium]